MSEKQKREPFVIRDTTIIDQVVNLDGNRFENVIFQRCTLAYSGGQLPDIQECRLEECSWQLKGAAHRTLHYLKHLVKTGDAATIAKVLGVTAEHLSEEAENASDT